MTRDDKKVSSPNYGGFQNEIYFQGLQGVIPEYPIDFVTLVARAEAAMPDYVLNYV
jgi:lactate 2-monooxygenase